MADHSPHQEKIIKRYYDRRDEIMLTRLQEIITELYLADSESKGELLWKRAESAMKSLRVPQNLAAHILAQRNIEILAKNLRSWLEKMKP